MNYFRRRESNCYFRIVAAGAWLLRAQHARQHCHVRIPPSPRNAHSGNSMAETTPRVHGPRQFSQSQAVLSPTQSQSLPVFTVPGRWFALVEYSHRHKVLKQFTYFQELKVQQPVSWPRSESGGKHNFFFHDDRRRSTTACIVIPTMKVLTAVPRCGALTRFYNTRSVLTF